MSAFFCGGAKLMRIDHARLLEIIGDAVIVADADGNIMYWNPAATRLFGFTESEALGRSLNLIMPERLRHRHNVGFAKSMETGTTRYGSDVLRVPATHKLGKPLSIAFTVAMLFDGDEPSGVVAVIRDDTARFQEERELKRRLAAAETQHPIAQASISSGSAGQ
jgi:PAS domain S-box-containing protein